MMYNIPVIHKIKKESDDVGAVGLDVEKSQRIALFSQSQAPLQVSRAQYQCANPALFAS